VTVERLERIRSQQLALIREYLVAIGEPLRAAKIPDHPPPILWVQPPWKGQPARMEDA
jgi:hypothetical protein